MLQVYGDAVCELCGHFDDGRSLHVCCSGLGVLRVGE